MAHRADRLPHIPTGNGGSDGSSLKEVLSADSRLANVPVLALSTADGALELVGARVQALRKPVEPDALVELARPHLVTPNEAVLVVEDDDYARSLLRRELETGGWAVRQARTDIEALESARAAPPTLLVVDSAMPGLDALAFLETLGRELGWLPPVVVLTVGELTETEVGRLRAPAGILTSDEARATAPLTVRLRTLLSARS